MKKHLAFFLLLLFSMATSTAQSGVDIKYGFTNYRVYSTNDGATVVGKTILVEHDGLTFAITPDGHSGLTGTGYKGFCLQVRNYTGKIFRMSRDSYITSAFKTIPIVDKMGTRGDFVVAGGIASRDFVQSYPEKDQAQLVFGCTINVIYELGGETKSFPIRLSSVAAKKKKR